MLKQYIGRVNVLPSNRC